MQVQQNFALHQLQQPLQVSSTSSAARTAAGAGQGSARGGIASARNNTAASMVSSTTPSENDEEGIGSSLADLDSLTDLLPMMAPDFVSILSNMGGFLPKANEGTPIAGLSARLLPKRGPDLFLKLGFLTRFYLSKARFSIHFLTTSHVVIVVSMIA